MVGSRINRQVRAITTEGIIQRNYAALINEKLAVVYGIYNLHNHLVGRPAAESFPGYWEAGLFSPPQGDDGFVLLSNQLAGSAFINNLLDGKVV